MSSRRNNQLDFNDIQILARQFRKNNNLNECEPVRLKSILQRNKILTVFLPLSDTFSGMAILTTRETNPKRLILINSRHSLGKQHFTICHEFFHLYFQEDFTYLLDTTGKFDKSDSLEFNADMFASFFLIPETGLLELIPKDERSRDKITLKTILAIEQYYSCSRTALLHRLKQTNRISSRLFDQYKLNVRRSALEYGYDTSLYEKGNDGLIIADYGIKAKELLDQGKISLSTYLSFLNDIGIDFSNFEDNAQNSSV
jgi:Zn-dependent peptidase ImmA (M78 family)